MTTLTRFKSTCYATQMLSSLFFRRFILACIFASGSLSDASTFAGPLDPQQLEPLNPEQERLAKLIWDRLYGVSDLYGDFHGTTEGAALELEILQNVTLIEKLLSEIQGPLSQFLAIERGVAKGELGTSGQELGPSASALIFGGVSFDVMLGVHELYGNRRLHLGFGFRPLIYNGDMCGFGAFGGIKGSRYCVSSPGVIGPDSFDAESVGAAVGIAGERIRNYRRDGLDYSSVMVGVGVGGYKADTQQSIFRLPIPWISMHTSYLKRIKKMRQSLAEIVISIHSLDLARAGGIFEKFNRELATLENQLSESWNREITPSPIPIPATNPFASAESLFSPSALRWAASQRSFVRRMMTCGARLGQIEKN